MWISYKLGNGPGGFRDIREPGYFDCKDTCSLTGLRGYHCCIVDILAGPCIGVSTRRAGLYPLDGVYGTDVHSDRDRGFESDNQTKW